MITNVAISRDRSRVANFQKRIKFEETKQKHEKLRKTEEVVVLKEAEEVC